MNSKVEYSIPKEVANSANKAKKKNDNNSVSARRFFSVINDALSFFMSLRHTKRDRTEIYLWVGALIGLDLFLLWFKLVVVIELPEIENVLYAFIVPFPLTTLLSPFMGIASLISSYPRVTTYFTAFNMLSLFNKLINLLISCFYYDEHAGLSYLGLIILSFGVSLMI